MSKLKNLSVEGTVILVTGGTSGIGRVVTTTLCAQGASVVFTGRNETEGNAINTELRGEGSDCHFVSADLREEGGITRVIDKCLSTYGRLDVAFNNAGIFDNSALFHEYKDEDWELMIASNLTSIFRCMKAELEVMIKQGEGVIINNASVVGHRATERATPGYVASKHGVIGLTRQAALQYANAGIRVNSISPGPTFTEIQQPLVDQGPDAVADHVGTLNPRAQFISPEEIADVVLFLAGSAPDMLTGQDIAIDGGQLYKL
ncbi:MAG: oxidoreductase [Actinobacteria bacterium]|jgi:NAD(P)-dependent dehydrogenase (short-subunit alcohol dehydrogenase family)|nr:oxidoreductase [Actinomycetota bacterium]|tara:strand:- start:19465 stop:20247 length:783 start_codon:yes stop_codon:yes gene_type:complete